MKKILAIMMLVASSGHAARVCPVAMPRPADTFDVECKIAGSAFVRCGGPVPTDTCAGLRQLALAQGLVTPDAAAWLQRSGYCPVPLDVGSGPMLVDFCPSAGARSCPVAIPAPADAFDTLCKTVGRDVTQRCATAIPPDLCASLIQTALTGAPPLLTADAVEVLQGNGFCPVIPSGLRMILDFCPVGCFAADTQILTGVSEDGHDRYAAAAQLLPSDPVMALSDEAGLDAIDLVSRQVDRVVYGPEEPPLFVFALATGATLRVTSHHPMVLDTGVIVEAAAVLPGAAFIGVDGQSVAVTAISREPATADVFNFRTDGDTQTSHVIGAETVLVGDLQLQNELAAEHGAIELRRRQEEQVR